jgi:hypothetical protein
MTREMQLSDIKAIAIEILILVILTSLMFTLARYVTETAVIRMVSETEATGRQLTLRQGLRLGWSARAARLFLIDLLIGLLVGGIVLLVLTLSITPIMLVVSRRFDAILLTAFGVLGMLILTGLLLTVSGALLSLIMQAIRRACVMDDMGVFASIGAGFIMLKHHLKDIGVTWLIWIAIRILWAPVSLLVVLILAPVLFIFLLTGAVIGFAPAALATVIALPFVNNTTAFIIGAIAGLSVLIFITIIPLLLIGGWVEIYKSSLWTLTYRELSTTERTVQAVQPQKQLASTHRVTE